MITKDKKIGVIMGGPSHEAEVSRRTGKAVAEALRSLGYPVVEVEYDPPRLAEQLQKAGVEVAFLALHGKYGEDGTIQGAMELMGIPYTGSGVMSSAITMDKIMSSRLFQAAGIRMADSHPYFREDSSLEAIEEDLLRRFRFPFVLKPACEGSTIGIKIVRSREELPEALRRVFRIEARILAETYLDGEEFTVSVLNGQALPVIQICPHSGAYDYYSKYTRGATEYIVPAPVPEALAEEMKQMALDGYRTAECRGAVRFDFRTDRRGMPYLLEANSIPGMTATSLVPKAAQAAGMDFPHLCEAILQGAGTGKV